MKITTEDGKLTVRLEYCGTETELCSSAAPHVSAMNIMTIMVVELVSATVIDVAWSNDWESAGRG